MVSSFGSTSSPQILFPHFSCSAFLKLAPSLAPTRTGTNIQRAWAKCVSHERCGLPSSQKVWRYWMWGCVTASQKKSCRPRKMPLFSSQISQNQSEIFSFPEQLSLPLNMSLERLYFDISCPKETFSNSWI